MGVDCLNAKPVKPHHRRACPCGMMIESQKNAAPQPTPPKKDGLGSPFLAINHRSAGTSPAVAETIQPAQRATDLSHGRQPVEPEARQIPQAPAGGDRFWPQARNMAPRWGASTESLQEPGRTKKLPYPRPPLPTSLEPGAANKRTQTA